MYTIILDLFDICIFLRLYSVLWPCNLMNRMKVADFPVKKASVSMASKSFGGLRMTHRQ